MNEAPLVKKDVGVVPEGEGWFVVNAQETPWYESSRFGMATRLEGKPPFPQLGVNLHVIWPGRPNCHYHAETHQEGFLVLAGECLLIVEEQERRLKAWDYFHCPPGTRHVFVGTGTEPCLMLMMGARGDGWKVTYPVSEVALKHGAGGREETDDPKVSYRDIPPRTPRATPVVLPQVPIPRLVPGA